MPIPQSALVPFFKAMKIALGAEAATTRVSVPGGFYMQKLGLRNANDIDVLLKGAVPINRIKLRNDILNLDKAFTPNLEKICGVTYRDSLSKKIIPIDILDESVTGFMPLGYLLSELKSTEIPWPEAHEFVKLKILSARDRKDTNRGLRDLDDVKALLVKDGFMVYKDDTEKAIVASALEKVLPTYLEQETEWSAEQWKIKLSLA